MIYNKKILVCGAGGFIGGHLVKSLLNDGHNVICADLKPFEYFCRLQSIIFIIV